MLLADDLEFLAHQGAAVIGAHAHQLHQAIGEIQYLQGFRELDELADIVGDALLRADGVVHTAAVVLLRDLGDG